MFSVDQKLHGGFWGKYREGFTLLETLLVMSIVGALMAIVLSQTNPRLIMANSRNAVRAVEIEQLLGAIMAFTIDNDGISPPGITLPPVYGSTTFSGAYIIDPSFDQPQTVFPFDVDGDGDLDVISGSKAGGGEVSWWEHSGTGTPTVPPLTWTKHVIDSNFKGRVVKAGDIDGDGKADIVAVDKGQQLVSWWRNLGGTPATFGSRIDIDDRYKSVRALDVVDMDGDGKLDVLAGSDNKEAVRWWKNDGSPLSPGWEWKAIETSKNDYVGDILGVNIDGDGDVDVLGAYENTLTWWENDGNPWQNSWMQYAIDSSSEQWEQVHAGKIDDDADTDVVAIAKNGRVSWWENNGTPAQNDWLEHVIASNFGGTAIHLVDFDLDNDLDVLGASEGGDKIVWWENKGGGAFSGTSVIVSGGEADGVVEVFGGDIDGDGDIDIIAAMEEANTIAWWENLTIPGYSASAAVANIDAVYKPICREGVSTVECDANGGISLDVLVPGHIAELPVDALARNDPVLTGYEVRHDPDTIKLFVRAPLAELEKTIELVGPVGVANCLIWDILQSERTCILFE